MAKSSITEVSANNTFQVWLDKTNELVDLVKTDILTASLVTSSGDITVGNATLQGIFTANTVIANNLLRVDTISPKIGSTNIQYTAPITVATSQTVLGRFTSATGPRISLFNDGDTDWQVGFENNVNKNFTISNGAATFRITSTGNLEITGILSGTAAIANTVALIATNTTDATHFPVFVDAATGNENIRTDTGFTYNPSTGTLTSTIFVGNLTGAVTGTVSSLSNHTTTNLTEGTNQYFTVARARSALPTTQGTGVTYNNTTGVFSIGQAVATTDNVQFANLTTTGTITSTGAITSNGDITAFAASSDVRKKENIVKIDNALQKVLQIGGYTYNFKNDDRKLAGVIAQELEEVLPEVIYEIDDVEFGKSKAVRYGNIVGLLIEAIKELKSEVDELKGLK